MTTRRTRRENGGKMIVSISLPEGTEWVSRVRDAAEHDMKNYQSCTQCILAAFMKELEIGNPLVLRAAGAMHGGMVCSLTCGIHSAGLMVLGLLMGRENLETGFDGLFPIVVPAQELVSRLNKRIGSHSCLELTGVDFTDLDKAMEFIVSEEHQKCISRVAEGAEEIGLFLKELEERGELFHYVG